VANTKNVACADNGVGAFWNDEKDKNSDFYTES
jgi:hypothetical protein